jgi:hypothetical protein
MTRSRDTADTQDNLGGAVAPYVAGKNRIINGDFTWAQRGTTFTLGAGAYTLDRWASLRDGNGTVTLSQQPFTAGSAPVTGYESQYFLQINCSSVGTTSYFTLEQPIEDVRTFANQTVTFSFWARVAAGPTTTGPYLRFNQNFGSGGSASVTTQSPGFVFTNEWKRYTYSVLIPSVSGKTIGASSNLAVQFILPTGGATGTLQFWGMQLEAGNVATPFARAGGSIGGELALCQRYYYLVTAGAGNPLAGIGFVASTTVFDAQLNLPVSMRIAPTVVDYSQVRVFTTTSGNVSGGTVAVFGSNNNVAYMRYTHGSPVFLLDQSGKMQSNATGAFIGVSAEL